MAEDRDRTDECGNPLRSEQKTMASSLDYAEYVIDQLTGVGVLRARKMFGEYMVYLNEKPVVLVCDNICYVKKHPIIDEIMSDAECGCPYHGAKEHYILDIDHSSEARRIVSLLETVTDYPKKKKSVKG